MNKFKFYYQLVNTTKTNLKLVQLCEIRKYKYFYINQHFYKKNLKKT